MIFEVDGRKIQSFEKIVINHDFNTIAATFAVSGVKNAKINALYHKKVVIREDSGAFALSGIITDVFESDNPVPEKPNLSGYSEAGILEDVTVSLQDYPLELSNVTIVDVVEKWAKRYINGNDFFVKDFEDAINVLFATVTAEPTERVKSIINRLATARGLFMTYATDGTGSQLRFYTNPLEFAKRYNSEKFIQNIEYGTAARELHSHITIHLQGGGDDSQIFTVENKLANSFRPISYVMTEGEGRFINFYAYKKIAAELLNITCNFTSEKVMRTGGIIKISGREWFITQSSREVTSASDLTKYTCVPIETYKV